MSKDENTVREYLAKVNRPYSLNDIVQNLHNEVTKAAAQKALDRLVALGKVNEKCYNKQKIYTIAQDADQKTNVQQDVQDMEMKVMYEPKQPFNVRYDELISFSTVALDHRKN